MTATAAVLGTAVQQLTMPITSAAVTPTAGRVIEVHVAVSGSSGATGALTTASITPSQGSWTWRLSQIAPATNTTVATYVFIADVPAGLTGTTTFQVAGSGGTVSAASIEVVEITGSDVAANAVFTGGQTNTASASATITLSQTPLTTDLVTVQWSSRNLHTAADYSASTFASLVFVQQSGASATQDIGTRSGSTSTACQVQGLNNVSNTGVTVLYPQAPSGGTGWTAGETASSGLTDTAAFDQTKPTTDDTGETDTFALAQGKFVTDDSGLTDTSTSSVGRGLGDPMDSSGLTDIQIVSVGRGLSDPLDSAGLADTNRFDQGKATIDNSGLTDSVVIVHGIFIAQTDSTGLTDTATEQLNAGGSSFTAGETASAGLTDTTAFDQSKPTTDSAGLTDSATLAGAYNRVTVDDSGLTDTSVISKGANSVSVDSSGLTDSALLSSAFSRAITDPSGLTDPVVFVVGRGASQTDVVGLTDSVVFVMSRAITIMDIAGMTETTVIVDSGSVTYRVKFGILKPRVRIGAPKGRIDMGEPKARISIGAPKL